MKLWTHEYHEELKTRFDDLTRQIPERMGQITDGRVAPSLDDLAIGSARQMNAAVLFFDIVGFTDRTSSDDETTLRRTLSMLDALIPTVMQIIYDHRGYVEKNTGDGVMALFTDGAHAEKVGSALDAAVTVFYVLRMFVNPYLEAKGVPPVDARIGIDYGKLLISKIGVHSGSADHQRNFLTAVGPTANIACRLQQHAGTNEIWVGDLVALNAPAWRQQMSFVGATIAGWPWVYVPSGQPYSVWHFTENRAEPIAWGQLMRFLAVPPPQLRG